MLSVNTNLSAMSIYRYLALNTASADQAIERLSSGQRINSAADAPLSFSEVREFDRALDLDDFS